ncbi:MAG: BrnA antitoxin family protein [Pseudomonadota bacterium]
MKKEYNLKNLRVKRRGILSALQAPEPVGNKVRITISLDQDVLDYFKAEATNPGALPYQTQINQVLRRLIDKSRRTSCDDVEELKAGLLHDAIFIRKLAKALDRRQTDK